jgi:hypothetical protein
MRTWEVWSGRRENREWGKERELKTHLLVRPVALVSDEDLVNSFRRVLLDVGVPRPDVY